MSVSGASLVKTQSCLDTFASFMSRRSALALTLRDRTWWYRAFGCASPVAGARVVAMELLLRTDAGGVCWPSRARLEAETGIDKRRLRRLFATMVSEGWVEYLTWEQRCDHCAKRGLPPRKPDDKNSIMYRIRFPSVAAFESARVRMTKAEDEGEL